MATLVKTGIGDGQTLTPVIITELYDAFTGDKLFDNLKINNTMKITHDGKVAIGTTNFSTPYELNVQGTVEADVGRFTNLIVTTQSIVTSSISQVSGSSIHGTVATDRHVFTGSLQISGSSIYDNYFLNNVAIGKTENTRNIFEVEGGVTVSTSITASDMTLSNNINANTASFVRVSVSGDSLISGDLTVEGNATINGNLTFGDADTDSVGFQADINSNFIPDVDSLYNIGSVSKNWKYGYIEELSSTNITASGDIKADGNISASGNVFGTNLISDSSSVSTRVTTLEQAPNGIFLPTGSIFATTNDIQITGSLNVSSVGSFNTINVGGGEFTSASLAAGGSGGGGGVSDFNAPTETASFGLIKQNGLNINEQFNRQITDMFEDDENGDLVHPPFDNPEVYVIDPEFELDENGDITLRERRLWSVFDASNFE